MHPSTMASSLGHPDLTIQEFDRLITLVYGGLDEPTPWTKLLNALLPLLGANYATLILRPPSPCLPWRVVFAGTALPEIAATYETFFYTIDPFANLPPNRIVTVSELIDEEEWLKSAIYQEFLKPLNIRHYMGADLEKENSVICRFRVSRAIGADPFTEADIALCNLLLPHIKQAVHLGSLKDILNTERQIYAGTLERLSVGTIMLDKKGHVLSTNQAANQMLAMHNGVSIVQGKLHTPKVEERRELHRLIERAIAAGGSSNPQVVAGMRITRTGGLDNLGILIRSVPVTEWSEAANRPAAIIIMRDSSSKVQGSQELMQRLYGLTPAEAILALKLLEGLTIDEAAYELSISRNTARCQLRAIFAKTGVTRQPELMSLFLTGIIPLG